MVNSILFVLFSICCGQTHSLDLMILFRVAQGFTGGVLIPLSFVAILTYLPPSKQPAVTVYSVPFRNGFCSRQLTSCPRAATRIRQHARPSAHRFHGSSRSVFFLHKAIVSWCWLRAARERNCFVLYETSTHYGCGWRALIQGSSVLIWMMLIPAAMALRKSSSSVPDPPCKVRKKPSPP